MIPTAEVIISRHYKEYKNGNKAYDWEIQAAIELAKLHVEAALKEASKQATLRIEETNTTIRYKSHHNGSKSQTWIVAEDSILNAYPLTNIK